jgi:predicted metal-dependent hydrolase
VARLAVRRSNWGERVRPRDPARDVSRQGRGRRGQGISDSFQRGLELIRQGEYFAAHEDLEDVWRAAPSQERDFYQGLVHFTVAWYQAGRGNRIGCERQLEKAARRLTGYAPGHRGVDVDSVLEQVGAAAKIVQSGSLELPPARI